MRYFGTMKNVDGILEVGGVSVEKLAKEYKTPLYVMDQQLIEDNMKKYIDNFKSDKFDTEIVYASKAFLSKAMCQLANRYGLSIDAVSAGELYSIKVSNFPMNRVHMHGNNKSLEELEMCLDWGNRYGLSIDAVSAGELYSIKVSNFPMNRVHMHGNNKSLEELEMCLDWGIGVVILDNKDEIDKLGRLAEEKNKTIKVMLRVNIGIDAHTHEYIRTSKHSSKFGESIFDENIYSIIEKILSYKNLEFLGFHCHIGSQIFDTKAFHEGIETMLNFTKEVSEKFNIYIPEMNLGGGFGVYYVDGDTEVDIEKFMLSMISHIEKTLEKENMKLDRVSIEPGRSIVGNAGGTLYTVGGTKETYGNL